jgi:glycosyltransferase involved in cell wall biosynthesis
MMATRVGVVVPTRNRRTWLTRTLARILAQVDVEVELVVVDEASSDDTPTYLAELGAEAPLTVVRHDEPKGLAAARNAGLAAVTAPWVAFCDDDDLWAPAKVSRQLAAVEAEPGARWSCTGTVRIDTDDVIIGHQRPPASGDVAALLRSHNAVPGGGSSLLVATDLVREVGGYDPWFTGCEDYEMAVKLALASPLASVDHPFVGYRVWPNSMSTNVAYMHQGHRRILERYRGDLGDDLLFRSAMEEHRYFGSLALRNGQRWLAGRHFGALAVRARRPRALAAAGLAVVAPRWLDERRLRATAEDVPPAWRAEAVAWLQAPSLVG